MKKYTLEQLKKEKIAINIKTEEEWEELIRKFKSHNINWYYNAEESPKFQEELSSVDIYTGKILCANLNYNILLGFLIITPDQIDWGEDDKAKAAQVTINGGIMPPTDWKITTATLKQDNPPAVITKAVKDWNAFKAFVKEIEMHGRGLTSSQLKTFMAKTRKDMGEQK
jgi:hypothetical protein